MNVNEAVDLATRLESLVTRSHAFKKTKDQILFEIEFLAKYYREYADELDAAMYNELGHAYEQYDDAMVTAGV